MDSSRMRLPLAVLIALCAVLLAPAAGHAADGTQGHAPIARPASPADQPPFDGGRTYQLAVPPPGRQSPQGFVLNARRAVAIASGSVGSLARGTTPRVRTRLGDDGRSQWQVDFFRPDGDDVAQVVIDDPTGRIVERWTGTQVETKLARGYEGAVGGKVNKWWIWLPLCVLFLAPFVDPRRPLRLIHLDLLALLGFSVSLFFFNKAKIELSVGLVYPVLAYVFLRMLVAGFRPLERRDRLLPIAPRNLLVAGIVALIAFHSA